MSTNPLGYVPDTDDSEDDRGSTEQVVNPVRPSYLPIIEEQEARIEEQILGYAFHPEANVR